MSAFCANFLPLLLSHLWQSTLFAFAILLANYLLRSRGAQIRYWLWFASSVKFLVPFSWLVAFGAQFSRHSLAVMPSHLPVYAGLYNSGTAVANTISEVPLVLVPRVSEATSLFHHAALALAIWAIGAIYVLALWSIRWRGVAAVKGRAFAPTAGREISIWHRLSRHQSIPLLMTDAHLEPFLLGVCPPVLIWPVELSERLDDLQIEAIMRHERLHATRRDNLTMWIHTLVEAVFWFHPIVWWIEHRLIEEREVACDEGVLQEGTKAEVYANGMLQTCRFCIEAQTHCASSLSGADLGKRVRSIMSYRSDGPTRATKRCVAVAGFLLACAPIAYGFVWKTPFYGQILHSTGPLPSFEVVTIKPWKPFFPPSAPTGAGRPQRVMKEVPVGPGGQPTDRVQFIGQISILISSAYSIPLDARGRIRGLPGWAESEAERYEVQAKIDEPAFASMQKMSNAEQLQQVSLMEQSLLSERFGLKVHFETVEAPIYALAIGKGGPKLAPATEGEASRLSNLGTASGNDMTAKSVTLAEFANSPLLRIGGRQIIDQTGLAGRFDFTLRWASDERGATGNGEDEFPSLFTAVQNQLGLKLVSTKGPVEVLVVDHIERPSPN
jgi:bla regulator protein BlaR1